MSNLAQNSLAYIPNVVNKFTVNDVINEMETRDILPEMDHVINGLL